jgi:16S rRNA (cytidine1402-2'-O)-methyltransferase
MSGTLYIVATPIGNVADFSERAIATLRTVSVIAVEDTRHSARLMQVYGIATPLLSCHEYNEAERCGALLQRLEQGEDIALISDAGTPLISDPGYHLVKQAHAQGVPVVPIPGACALIAALCSAGLPTDRFCFEGFLPAKESARASKLQELQDETRTLVFYEAPHRIVECLQSMALCFGGERQITLARELTKTYETIKQGSLTELHAFVQADDNQQKGEFVLVLAGADKKHSDTSTVATEQVLKILLSELPVKQAATLAAKITGEKKNKLYDLALAWQKQSQSD